MAFSLRQWTVPELLDRYRGYLILGFMCGVVGLSSPVQSQENLPLETPEPRGDSTETPLPKQRKQWEDILAPVHARSVTIVVGTYEQRPFVFWDDDQTYGYGVEVWDTIATALDVRTELVRYKSVAALLEAVKQGDVDVGVSGISITAAREGGGFDFSYPIYHGGLQLVVKQQDLSPVVVLVQQLGGRQTLVAIVRLICLSLMAGTLIWLTERGRNPDFPDNILSGIGQGIWFAVVTLGTFGYGDVTPRSVTGRFLASIWMAFSFFVLGDFISSLTAARQAHVEGATLATLTGKTLGATANTSAYYFLLHKPIRLESFNTFADAVHALRNDQVVGIVGDYPTARYLVSQQPDFVLGGSLLDHESYGLVTADGNELLLEAINRELLKLERSGQLQSIKEEWFGGSPDL
ncbi:MAG: transporter substrate-binding domain-containing protein [Prochlorotrichaceae cyanobacterium]